MKSESGKLIDEVEKEFGRFAAFLTGLFLLACEVAKYVVIVHFVLKFW